MRMTLKSLALFAMLLIALTPLFNGCASKPKSLLVAYPGYFEIPSGSTAIAEMNFGEGLKAQPVKTDRIYYCYDQDTQLDALAVKKGK